jgi:hypothetical protein
MYNLFVLQCNIYIIKIHKNKEELMAVVIIEVESCEGLNCENLVFEKSLGIYCDHSDMGYRKMKSLGILEEFEKMFRSREGIPVQCPRRLR